jgi:hypothetical protein
MSTRFVGCHGCHRRQLTKSLFMFLMINSALISVEYVHSPVFGPQGSLSQNRLKQQPSRICTHTSKTEFNFLRPTIHRSFLTLSRALKMGSASEWANSNTTPSSNSALAGLCIIPPEELLPAIQSIRKVHDKRFRQWFPNIPLIFPFLRTSPITKEILREAAETMAPALARFSPFQVPLPPSPCFPNGPRRAHRGTAARTRHGLTDEQVTMDRMEVVFHRNRWCVWLVARPSDALVDLQVPSPLSPAPPPPNPRIPFCGRQVAAAAAARPPTSGRPRART